VGTNSINWTDSVYVVGDFEGTVDFDPGSGVTNLSSAGSSDAFVLKLDSTGGYGWSRRFGGTSADSANFLSGYDNGSEHLYISGVFAGTIVLDIFGGTTTLSSAGLSDAFVLKLDPSGNFSWAERFGGTGIDSAKSISISRQFQTSNLEGLYISGGFDGTVDFDPGSGVTNLTSTGLSDAFVLKLNLSGGFVWAKKIGGSTSSDQVLIDEIRANYFGQSFILGKFFGTVNFDTSSNLQSFSSSTNWSLFLLKLSAEGNSISVPVTTVPVTTVPVTTVPVTTVPVTTVPVTTVPVTQIQAPATTIPFVMLPSEPRNVKVTRKSPTSLTVKVSWSRPIKSEGNLWYRVYPSEWVAETGCTTFKLSCEFKMWPGEAYSIVVKAYNINGVASTASRKAKKIVAPLSRLIKGERQWPTEARDDQGSRCSRAAVTNGYRWPVKEISGFRRLHSTCNGKVFFISNSRFSIASVRLFEREIPGQLQPGLSVSEESIVAALDLTGNDERLLNRAVSSIGNQLKKLGYYVDRDGLYPLKSSCVAQRNDLLPVVSAFWPSPLSARNWGSFDCRISGYKKEFERNFFGPSFGERKPRIDFKWTYDPVNCKRKPCEAQPNGNGTLDLKYLSLVIRIS
jgi:hypothetical protein